MKSIKQLFALGVIVLLLGPSGVLAQDTTATINGQEIDPSGAVVSGAEITLTSLQTHEARTTKTADDGYYSLTFIPPGLYDFSVKAQGFKEFLNKNVELFVNDRKTINIQLEAGAVSETVTVTADAPVVQST